MRPTLGGAGHGVPSSQKTGSSMSVIMPIYTIGIVIFFSYTLMKLLFKKQPDGVGGYLYPPVEPDPRFRREVFESERCRYTPRLSRDPTGKIVVNAMSALLDEVNQEIEARRKTNQEIYLQGALPAQSQILVTESAVVTESAPSDVNTDPAVVLAGKMTLSVISLDSMHENEKTVNELEPPPPIEVAPADDILDINGDNENTEEEPPDESKYTTASSATVAENEISEDEGNDNEALDDDGDLEKINDFVIEVNHLASANGTETRDGNIEEDIEEIKVEEEEFVIEDGGEVEDDIEEIEYVEDEEAEEIEVDEREKVKALTEIAEEIKAECTADKDEVVEVEEREGEKVKVEEVVEIDERSKDARKVKEDEEVVQAEENIKEAEDEEEVVEIDEKGKDERKVKEDEEVVRVEENIKEDEEEVVEIDEEIVENDDEVEDAEEVDVEAEVSDEEHVENDEKVIDQKIIAKGECENVKCEEEIEQDEKGIQQDAEEQEEKEGVEIDVKVKDDKKSNEYKSEEA